MRFFKHSPLIGGALALLLTVSMLSVGSMAGCSELTPEQKAQAIATAQATEQGARGQRERLESALPEQEAQAGSAAADATALEQAGADPALVAKAKKKAAAEQQEVDDILDAVAKLKKVEEYARLGSTVVEVSVGPDGQVDFAKAGSTVAAVLPFPFNLIGTAGIPLLLWGIREIQAAARRKREAKALAKAEAEAKTAVAAAKSIVNGIDAVRAESAAVREGMQENKSLLITNYTPEAWDIVAAERTT